MLKHRILIALCYKTTFLKQKNIYIMITLITKLVNLLSLSFFSHNTIYDRTFSFLNSSIWFERFYM